MNIRTCLVIALLLSVVGWLVPSGVEKIAAFFLSAFLFLIAFAHWRTRE